MGGEACVNEEERKWCQQAEGSNREEKRAEACRRLGDLGFEAGPPRLEQELRSMSINTLERIIEDGIEDSEEVKEAACEALGHLAAHLRPSTTYAALKMATENHGYRCQSAAGRALGKIQEVKKNDKI